MNAARTLSPEERATLAALADIIAPRSGAMPSASEIGLAGAPIDRLLAARPDLLAPLAELLEQLRGREPGVAMLQLDAGPPAERALLMQAVAGAYYMDASVRAALGYPGQRRMSPG